MCVCVCVKGGECILGDMCDCLEVTHSRANLPSASDWNAAGTCKEHGACLMPLKLVSQCRLFGWLVGGWEQRHVHHIPLACSHLPRLPCGALVTFLP